MTDLSSFFQSRVARYTPPALFGALLIALLFFALSRVSNASTPVSTSTGHFAYPTTTRGSTTFTQTFITPQLPVGTNVTDVTVTLYNVVYQRSYDTAETSGQAEGLVTYSAPDSYLGLTLVGPDGLTYHVSRVLLAPFPVSIPAGGTRVHNSPWDQSSGTQQIPAIQPVTLTFAVNTPGFCEGPSPDGNQWRVVVDVSRIKTVYTSGQIGDRQSLWVGGTYDITFNN